jgi:teichoic acid transport system permease protein
MKKILALPAELYQNRKLVLSLAKNDFKTKYAGSYLGIVWAFIQPIVTILVYWFVFSVGLKAGTVSDYPFVLYLVSGIVPWFFFQDALNGGTNALIEYNYLVKKVVFKISILPIVKIISALFVHVFFVVFALILCACYGYTPSLYTLQIIYYSICTFLLVLGLVYATSAIVIFFRDPDHQHFSPGWRMAYTDHVGYQYAVFTSMADQAVQAESDVLCSYGLS